MNVVTDIPLNVNPLDSIKSSLNQLEMFHMDFVELMDDEHMMYFNDLCELRDKTELLRSEYSVLYSKLLE
jgi:DNA-dependent RNA polymerase auxiliary subunit epsilon